MRLIVAALREKFVSSSPSEPPARKVFEPYMTPKRMREFKARVEEVMQLLEEAEKRGPRDD